MLKLVSVKNCETLIIVDFSNLAYACYYGGGFGKSEPKTKGQVIFMAIKKVVNHLRQLGDDKTAIIFALDNSATHKKEILPSYKGQRKRLEADEDPRPALKEFLQYTKTYFSEEKSNEADDVVASIVKKYKEDKKIIIISSDQDMLQLKSETVFNFNLTKGEFYDKTWFKEKYGLKKWSRIVLYKAVFGDSSDNIKPAFPRMRKTYLLPSINACDGTLKHFIELFNETTTSDKTKEVFNSNLKSLRINYQIVKLNRNLEYELQRNIPDEKAIRKLCVRYKIKHLDKELNILL